jgi:acetyl esterase/lipase
MTASSAEHPLPPGRGRHLFAAIGYAIRAIKALPAPLRERALDALTGGVSSNLPPFPDVLRLVEAAGGIPDGKRWQERLLVGRPDLRAVRTREISEVCDVRARLYLPPSGAPAPTAALVWVHGGAFVLGSLDAKEAHWPAMELAAGGIPVLSVDYRLCIHGVHYPAPQDDVLSAWRWAVAHADELGVDPANLHLGGGSAGGCIVAGVALRLRDDGQALPASLYLAYPVLEGRLPPASPSMAAMLASSKLPPDGWITAMFATWAGPISASDPYVAPALADLAGLPPTYVLTCGRDALRRSSEPYAQRLSEAGVAVWHDLFPEAEHAPLDRPGTPDGDRALARLRAWLTGGAAGLGA